jgi:hypothetical protein
MIHLLSVSLITYDRNEKNVFDWTVNQATETSKNSISNRPLIIAMGLFLFLATAMVVVWQNSRLAVLWDLTYVLENAFRISNGPAALSRFSFSVRASYVPVSSGRHQANRPRLLAHDCLLRHRGRSGHRSHVPNYHEFAGSSGGRPVARLPSEPTAYCIGHLLCISASVL